MRPCIPVFLKVQELDWASHPLSKILEDNISATALFDTIGKPVIVTDSPAITEIASRHGLNTFQTALPQPETRDFFQSCLECFRIAGIRGRILFLDFRYPRLGRKVIEEIIKKYQMQPDRPLVCMHRRERNHPFYLRRFIGIRGSGIIHLLENGNVDGKYRFSRAFPIEVNGDMDLFHHEGNGISLQLLDDSKAIIKLSGQHPASLMGIGVGSGPDISINRWKKQYLVRSPDCPEGKLVLLPFNINGIIPDQGLEVRLKMGVTPLPLDSLSGISGFIYTLIQDRGSRSFDMEIRFNPEGKLWEETWATQTGKRITGRQQMPLLYESGGPVIIANKHEIERLVESPSQIELQGYVLEKRECICIRDRIDLIRFQLLEERTSATQ